MKKHLTERQERASELGRMDMANRCGFCKGALPKGRRTITRFGRPERFCSDGCVDDATERDQQLQLMKARR